MLQGNNLLNLSLEEVLILLGMEIQVVLPQALDGWQDLVEEVLVVLEVITLILVLLEVLWVEQESNFLIFPDLYLVSLHWAP